MDNNYTSRYPGLRSFERGEEDIFKGRKKEADQLFSLLSVRSLVVLFARSGLGKSSLINAGLIPELEKNNFFPIAIRVQDTEVSPLDLLKNQLLPHLDEKELLKHAGKTAETASVWEMTKACHFGKEGKETPVLIFDQFEEFFEHNRNNRQEFAELMSDLVYDRLPYDIQQQFLDLSGAEQDEHFHWYEPIDIKVLFSIRSDRLSKMHELTEAIPNILNDRFEIFPLSADNAKAAIVEPAHLKLDLFESLPFEYQENTIKEIITYLKDQREKEIEPFQLQIICQELEEKVLKRQKDNPEIVVTPDYLGGKEGMDNMLFNFYEKRINVLDEVDREKACDLMERVLLVDNRRVGVAELVITKKYKLKPALLEHLLKSRLVRKETGRLGSTYEVSHDTLVQAISTYREKRENVRKATELESLRKRRKFYLRFLYLFAIPVVIGLAVALHRAWESLRIGDEAQKQQQVILDGYQEMEQLNRNLDSQLKALDSVYTDMDTSLVLLITRYRKRIDENQQNRPSFMNVYGLAYLYHRQENYTEAIKYFSQGIDMRKDSPLPIYYNNRGDAYFNNGAFQSSIKDYTRAIQLAENNDIYYSNRGLAYERLGMLDSALYNYDLAARKDVDNGYYRVQRATIYQMLAQDASIGSTRWDSLLKRSSLDYKDALLLDYNTTQVYNGRGSIYFMRNEMDSAKQNFEKAFEVDSTNYQSLQNLGIVAFEQRDYYKSLDYLEQVYQADEQASGIDISLGNTHWALGNLAEARTFFQKALDRNATDISAIIGLGNVAFIESKFDEAIKYYEEIEKIDPDNPNILNNIAVVYYQATYKNRTFLAAALPRLDKAIKLDPFNKGAYSNRAFVNQQLDRLELADKDARKALELDPELGDAHAALAFTYLKKGNLELFKENIHKAINAKEAYNLKKEYEAGNEPVLDNFLDDKELRTMLGLDVVME